jgi:hypothetical protein
MHCNVYTMYSENLSDFSVEIVEEQRWVVTFEMPASSLYPGETHRLEFTFCEQYPIESPQVQWNWTRLDNLWLNHLLTYLLTYLLNHSHSLTHPFTPSFHTLSNFCTFAL